MSEQFQVAIVGGGMTGLALAVALARQGMKIAVIDKSDFKQQQLPEFDGRVCAISLGSQRILHNIGAWQGMQPHAQPIWDIRVHEEGGFGHVHYDHQDIGDEPMGHIIENRHTRAALLAEAKRYKEITLIAPEMVEEVAREEGGVELQLHSQKKIRASLLVAADGRFSKLRDWAEIPAIKRDYEQIAIVTTIKHEQPHNGLALERFFTTGPFAVLPMLGNRSSLVWVEPTKTAQAIMALPQEEVLAYLEQKMQGYLGQVEFETRLWSYPLIAMLAQDYIADRFALLGDAAHGIHPIAGQGVNLGFRDVAVLEDVLAEALQAGEDIGSHGVLNRYQKWRRFDGGVMTGAMDGLNYLFSNDIKSVALARNTGFSLVNKWPQMRNFFMRHAMGTEGDLPRLAKAVSPK